MYVEPQTFDLCLGMSQASKNTGQFCIWVSGGFPRIVLLEEVKLLTNYYFGFRVVEPKMLQGNAGVQDVINKQSELFIKQFVPQTAVSYIQITNNADKGLFATF